MQFSACTDTGLVRPVNQDAMAWEVLRPEEPVAFLAVADGMGGAAGGDVASRLAVQTVLARVQAEGLGWAGDAERLEGLRQATLAAHGALLAEQERRPALAGMGTTLTAVLAWGPSLYLVHAGDSRAYLLRGGTIVRLTDDHSVVGALVRDGRLTEDEAQQHPQRHLLTSALGARGPLQIDVRTAQWQPGDILLLCTDGLTSLVGTKDLLAAAGDGAGFDGLAERLVELAKRRGGYDNITVLAARYDGTGPGAGRAKEVNG